MNEKIYKTTAGRKKLPPEQKKVPVVIYLRQEEIENMGGMETVKRYLIKASERMPYEKIDNQPTRPHRPKPA